MITDIKITHLFVVVNISLKNIYCFIVFSQSSQVP